MNKNIIYKFAKMTPKPIRKLVKVFYNPVIPVISKLDYGEDSYPEATTLMCNKLRKIVNKVDGDIIEFGCYKCGATIKLAKTLKETNSNKKIYALDTFSGLPKETIGKDNIKDFYKNSMDENDIEKVRKVLIKNKVDNNIILMKGLFKENIPKLKNKRFCFAFVDADLYQGTKEALEFLLPRINKGGIIFIDDYSSESWGGGKESCLRSFVGK
jgi:hypothetical protein